MASDVNTRQIPVISDIERIKKIVELLEFFGEKVGTILENLPAPQSLTSGGAEKTGSGGGKYLRKYFLLQQPLRNVEYVTISGVI